MQNDLISRSTLLELVDVFSCYNPDCEDIECEFSFIHKADVENAPAVDAVEVVRCKDCAKCDHVKETPVDGGVWICHLLRMLVYENHFCSYGKRRADDGKL